MFVQGKILGRSNESGQPTIRLDRYTRGIVVIDIEHAMIHVGRAFAFSERDVDVDTGDPKIFTFQTPSESTAEIHFEWNVDASAAVNIDLIEGSTLSTLGTLVTPINRKRESSNTSFMTVRKNGNIATQGSVVLDEKRIGVGGNPSQSAPGVGSARYEWELNPNTTYEFRVTPDADNTEVDISFNWYEIVDSDWI